MFTEDIRSAVEKASGKTGSLSFRAEAVSYGEMRSVLEKNCRLFSDGFEASDTTPAAAALREISKRIGKNGMWSVDSVPHDLGKTKRMRKKGRIRYAF